MNKNNKYFIKNQLLANIWQNYEQKTTPFHIQHGWAKCKNIKIVALYCTLPHYWNLFCLQKACSKTVYSTALQLSI